MTTILDAMKQAREALEFANSFASINSGKREIYEAAITALNAAIEQMESVEPVAFEDVGGCMSDLISRLKKHTTPGHPGIIDEAIEEIARLRNIEEAAVSACGDTPWQGDEWYSLMIALDKALKGDV